jgi:hypothetical protein
MRKTLLVALLACAAAPVAAQPPLDPRDEDLIRSLPAPEQVEVAGDVADAALGAILDTPVGPIRDAVDPGRRHRGDRDETLGDLASRDDPYFRDRMRGEIAAASVMVNVLADRLAVLAPVLRDTVEDAERRIDDAVGRRGDRAPY